MESKAKCNVETSPAGSLHRYFFFFFLSSTSSSFLTFFFFFKEILGTRTLAIPRTTLLSDHLSRSCKRLTRSARVITFRLLIAPARTFKLLSRVIKTYTPKDDQCDFLGRSQILARVGTPHKAKTARLPPILANARNYREFRRFPG